jgi:C-terminal peptidase prc
MLLCLLIGLCMIVGGVGWWAATSISPPTATPVPTAQVVPDQTTTRQLRVFRELWHAVETEYLYPDYNGVDWQAVGEEYRARIEAGLSDEAFWAAMDEMLARLNDDHSAFLSPVQVAEEDAVTMGALNYVGVGITTAALPEKGYSVILQVIPGGPADQAGLRSHDRILAVDGVPACCDAYGYDILDRLLGAEGSSVEVEAQTPGQPSRRVTLTRARIQGAFPIETRRLGDVAGINDVGYILIPTLMDERLPGQVSRALERFAAEGELAGLILDLRINPGGTETSLWQTLSLFADGEMGHFVSREEEIPLRVIGRDVAGSQSVELVILVGRETASFAEVLSGVLREAGRARIVGRTTLGNVEVVHGYDFEDGSRAWIAQETFRPPSGADWEETGVVPDVEILLDWDEFTAEDDPQLQAALELLCP